MLAKEVGMDLMTMEQRLESLESKVLVENGGVPDNIVYLRQQVDDLRQKIEVTLLLYKSHFFQCWSTLPYAWDQTCQISRIPRTRPVNLSGWKYWRFNFLILQKS